MLKPVDPLAASGLLQPRLSAESMFPIVLQGVCLRFGSKTVIDDLNLELQVQGITALMGPNGAGKSLLLRLIAGLIPAHSGQVLWGGSQQLGPGALGFVFQRPVLLRRSVRANLLHALALAGVDGPQRAAQCDALLTLGGMTALAESPARSLSGGEQQRLSLLRALACRPALLLLDEPSASLDPQATFLIENLIREASQAGVKVIVVTHDQGQAARLSDHVIFMHQGRVLEQQSTALFLNHTLTPQARAYLAGQLLLE